MQRVKGASSWGSQAQAANDSSALNRYVERLGRVVGRRQTEIALTEARRSAERSAETAHIAMLHAEAANAAKSAFLANMSHELRTPLNAIIGFSEILDRDLEATAVDPKHREYVRDINGSGLHLLRLLNDILDLARIEAGRLDLSVDFIDLQGCVRSAMTMIGPRADRAEVGLKTDLPTPCPGITADETKLRQVLLNLLSNAIKFTPAGGTVTLTAALDADGGLAISIADTGIGIAAEDIPRALSPFGQVESALNRKYDGAGLGLPISRALMELHGGRLEIESQVGVGTTVTVTLPAGRVLRPA